MEALNSPDGVPEVGSTWERVVQSTYATATAKSVETYQAEMANVRFPVSFISLMAAHSDAQAKAISVFDKFTQVDNEREIYNTSLETMTVSNIAIIQYNYFHSYRNCFFVHGQLVLSSNICFRWKM